MKTTPIFFLLGIFLGGSLCTASTYNDYSDSSTRDHLELRTGHVDSVGLVLDESEFISDSAYAVDDEIWRELRQAEEYFAQGVAANQDADWEEAQYYLERALRQLADLDIDTSEAGPESRKYSSLIGKIVADYRLTLLSLGSIPDDATPSAFMEQFGGMNKFGELITIGEKKPITYNVPIVINEKVKNSIIYFQTVGHEAFTKWLERSGKYIPMMVKILEEHGVPSDIVYLPIIESGFNCKAYSWARASGPWQFIASTGRMYDLNRNWWYDERRDFVKSTHAAARFLKFLYERYDDWELALAAYNGGPGRIDRTIKRQKTRNFWDMKLKKQTMDYVPFYMAATIIAKDPELYGFHIEYDDPIAYDVVTLEKCLDLKTIAKASGTTIAVLKDLNPELLRNVTPPQIKDYQFRLPKGSKAKFLAELPKLKSPKETSWARHNIRRGESVSSIAAKYGVSQYAILEANNLNRRSRIYAGKSLIIPVPLDGRGSSSRKRKSSPRIAAGDNTYIVERGDNLWDIASSFSTTPKELRRINYLGNSSRIYVRQVLKLPGSAKVTQKAKRKNYDKQPAGDSKSYTVKKGDTLWEIARRFGTSTAALRRLNGLKRSSRIYVKQKLLVPGSESARGDYTVYIVRRGDTLGKIARAFGTTVSGLKNLNSIMDVTKLKIGTRLKIGR